MGPSDEDCTMATSQAIRQQQSARSQAAGPASTLPSAPSRVQASSQPSSLRCSPLSSYSGPASPATWATAPLPFHSPTLPIKFFLPGALPSSPWTGRNDSAWDWDTDRPQSSPGFLPVSFQVLQDRAFPFPGCLSHDHALPSSGLTAWQSRSQTLSPHTVGPGAYTTVGRAAHPGRLLLLPSWTQGAEGAEGAAEILCHCVGLKPLWPGTHPQGRPAGWLVQALRR